MDFPYEYDFGNNVVWPFDCYVLGHAIYDFPFHVDGWRCSATMLCSSVGLRSYVRPCRVMLADSLVPGSRYTRTYTCEVWHCETL
eukprot:jgi/Botrbrau1/22548/Bobra.114_2s0071.1